MATSLADLATQFGCELIGDPSVTVSRVATLSGADDQCVSFLSNPAYREQLGSTRAAAVILSAGDAPACPVASLVDPNPYLLYARVAAVLHPPASPSAGIHSSAVVAGTARISPDAHLAANVVVGENSVVSDGVVIGPNSIIGDNCSVGVGTRLIANVTLVDDVVIGARCIVHPGAVIGCDGFGNAMSNTGWVKVPQVGGVRIGNDVEIGANTTIDRGAIEHTVIENGVRLDNLVQIAHNVCVGEHSALAAMTGISDSTVIGKRCMFGGQTGTVGHLTICDDVIVTGKSMVTKSISAPGTYSGGFAAEEAGTWKKRLARFKRLDRLAARVAAIEQKRHNDEQ
jgi:UDP-3-O-[3-hydroxymyristoyl] glucosamine N-acyltransferase